MSTVEETAEEVLVIPRTAMKQACGEPHGFSPTPSGEAQLRGLIAAGRPTFMLRTMAEIDPTHKQLIPYVVLRCGSSAGPTLFMYTRTKHGGEPRLHDNRSIGIGGHINPRDVAGGEHDGFGAFQQAMERELHEEVEISTSRISTQYLGLLNDETTPVNSVHLGVVYLIQLSQPFVQLRENTAKQGGFRTYDAIQEQYDSLETWSQLVFDYIRSLK